MPRWWVETFGDPCRSCGYKWTIAEPVAVARVATAPARYAELLGSATGGERHPGLAWSVKAYVFHVADNLRIWAERLGVACVGGGASVVAYDDNLLAQARAYEQMTLAGALWALEESVGCWTRSISAASQVQVQLDHPQRGILSVSDVIRSNCHDVDHHEWDVRRSLGVI